MRDFIVAGLRNGEDAIIVATQAHREKLDVALAEEGIDLSAARAEGHYLSLDPARTLSTFMVDGNLDLPLFEKAIGGIIPRAAKEGRGLRVFGEMVALLWEEGKRLRSDPPGGTLELPVGDSSLRRDVRLSDAQLQSRGGHGAI